jgi:hypothetical protein
LPRLDLDTLHEVKILTKPEWTGCKFGFQAAVNGEVVTIHIGAYHRYLAEEISKKVQSDPVSIVVNRVPWIFGKMRKSGIWLYLMEIKES